jgi:hypothetical protein
MIQQHATSQVAASHPADESDDLKAGAAFANELEFLERNVKDIRQLREASHHLPLSLDNVKHFDAVTRGGVGLALRLGKTDLLDRQLTSWAVYFERHIDDLLKIYKLVEDGTVTDPHALTRAYEMSADILGALDRTITARLAS